MRTPYSVLTRSRGGLIFIILLTTLLMSACSGDPQVRQHAMASEQQYQKALLDARHLGVNDLVLQSVIQQAQQLHSSQPPSSLFSNRPIDEYYQRQSSSYALLTARLQHFVSAPTQAEIAEANSAFNQSQAMLAAQTASNLPIASIRTQLTQLQSQLGKARFAGDYLYVQQQSAQYQTMIHALPDMSAHLDGIKSILGLLEHTRLQTTKLFSLYQADQNDFKHLSTYPQFQQLRPRLASHYQQAQGMAVQVAPQIVAYRMQVLSSLVAQITAAHVQDPSYQQHLQADNSFVAHHPMMNFGQLQQFVQQVDADTTKAQFTLLKTQTKTFLQQFHHEVAQWSAAHLYHDDYDGHPYAIDTSYLPDNFGNDADDLLNSAHTVTDLQKAMTLAQNLQFSHQLLERDYADHTPYNKVHQTDTLALDHYHLQKGQVMVVSLAQQALRLYQDGKLVRAFQVTTGRAERPSPPGLFSVLSRLSPTEFISDEPPGSPYWYPPTHINYAILMRADGYFVHDSWWRDDYGPGTQFPHYDPAGDESFAGNGSHGCVNLPTDEASWLFRTTNWNTSIVVY